uniref:Prolyl endopeptidase n=1 Tax=Oryzias latipes TaxID=8090 RepID=A0A3P9KTB9_ORYLA
MVGLSSLIGSSCRFFKRSWGQIAEFTFCKQKTRMIGFAQRSCVSEPSSAEYFSHSTEKYRDLQGYFTRRLKEKYHQFSHIPHYSVLCGHDYDYFTQNDGIHRIQKKGSVPVPEQVLDVKETLGGEDEMQTERRQKFQWTVQRMRLSPQEKHLAASLKCSHGQNMRFVVVRLKKRNLPSTQHVIATLERVFSFEWATDDVLFYTTMEGLRSRAVFRLDVMSSGNRITCVYEEAEPDVFVEVALSRNRQILTINCSSRSKSEVLLCDVKNSQLEPVVVQPRQKDLLFFLEHWKRWLIILANTGPGQEYQVLQAPVSEPSMASWVPIFVPDPGTVIKDMEVIGDHCVLIATTSTNELILIVVTLTNPKEAYVVQLPSWVCAIETKKPGMAEEQQNVLEFLVSSPVQPPVSCCLHPDNRLLLSGRDGSSTKKQAKYFTTRLEVRSPDGTLVPVTLLHTVPVKGLRKAPLLVHVYGAYGRDLNMEFCPEKRLLLEHGWALAYCHIRGGGERGLSWHRQARVEGKLKGVEDLQTCLHHLFSLGVSAPSLTALTAHSAGAVPVGALCNRDPHLMQAVLLQAPFLDVLGSMENLDLPLTLEDRDEWGDAVGNVKHRQLLASYCPLQNITPQHYPSMLLTTYREDPRIPLAGVLKYTDLLKKAIGTHISSNPKPECAPNIVLNVQPGTNHLGPEDYEQMLMEEALKLAFLYTELGLDRPLLSRKRKR